MLFKMYSATVCPFTFKKASQRGSLLHQKLRDPKRLQCTNQRHSSRVVDIRKVAVQPCPVQATKQDKARYQERAETKKLSRRALSAGVMISPTIFTGNGFAEVPDETITAKIYLEIGVCPEDFNPGRTLGEMAVCNDTEPLGKVVLGLYGDVVPETVRIFTDLITGKNDTGGYKGTVFNKVIPGQYVTAGRQGPRRLGQLENVQAPTNSDVLSSKAFRLTAARPGAVSLFVQNEGVNRQRGRTEFAIATGPVPAFDLDGENIVFGRVLEGLEVMDAVARTPTFMPPERVRIMNNLAGAVGDDRAAKARNAWSRPRRPVVITDCGIVP